VQIIDITHVLLRVGEEDEKAVRTESDFRNNSSSRFPLDGKQCSRRQSVKDSYLFCVINLNSIQFTTMDKVRERS
jgi:hypothetical protein